MYCEGFNPSLTGELGIAPTMIGQSYRKWQFFLYRNCLFYFYKGDFLMKNQIALVRKKVTSMIFAAKIKAAEIANRTEVVLTDRKGQGALDTAIQVLVSVVLGALILAGLYLILNATVLPNIKQRITDMFNYKG